MSLYTHVTVLPGTTRSIRPPPRHLFLASSWDISSRWALLPSRLKLSSVGLLACKTKIGFRCTDCNLWPLNVGNSHPFTIYSTFRIKKHCNCLNSFTQDNYKRWEHTLHKDRNSSSNAKSAVTKWVNAHRASLTRHVWFLQKVWIRFTQRWQK